MKTKKLICIMLSVVMITGTVSSLFVANAAEEYHAGGLIWDDWDNIDMDMLFSDSIYGRSLPDAVDLTDSFPKPGYQGMQNSCVAWAVAYALKTHQEYVKRAWTNNVRSHTFSPSFIYNQCNGGVDGGMTISDAMNFIVNNGVCTLPYFDCDESDCTTQPGQFSRANALLYKGQSCGTIQGIETMKQRLAMGDGIVIGIQLYDDFDEISPDNMIYDTISGQSRGGHAICLIGYDDSLGAFKFINSWGEEWGLKGYGWISYDFVNDPDINGHGAACGYVMTSRTSDSYVLGDIDNDSRVTVADARAVLRCSMNIETFSYLRKTISDVNGDGRVTTADARYILRYASKLTNGLPLYE